MPMIKSLVMGIKEILKSDKCEMCGCKLQVLSWNRCIDCDKVHKRMRDRTYQRKNKKHKAKIDSIRYFFKKAYRQWKEISPIVKPIQYRELNLNEIHALHFRCDKKKALQSDVLVYDENLCVIGYKEPIKIRENLI